MKNTELKELILSCAKKYNVSSVETSLQKAVEQQSVKIGFLGAFSAGKTSLINSILGLNLPTDISATTKSICMIGLKSRLIPGLSSILAHRKKGVLRRRIYRPCQLMYSKRHPLLQSLKSIDTLKGLGQCSTECLLYFIGVLTGNSSASGNFNSAEELFGAVNNEVLKFVISKHGMINPVCFHISVQI